MATFLSSSINLIHITSSKNNIYFNDSTNNAGYEKFRYLISLKNSINWYAANSEYYNFDSISSSVANSSSCTIINIPSIFYGSSLKRGSIKLSFFYSGSLVGTLEDFKYNGELVQTSPSGSNGSGSTAGVVLYNEGIVILTGSWSLAKSFKDKYEYISNSAGDTTFYIEPRWDCWGASYFATSSLESSSFGFNFEGNNKTPSLTLFAHANKNSFNNSNNPTFIKYSSNLKPVSSSNVYIEPNNTEITNTVYESYSNYTGSFEKQTFISKIGIYDESKNLIAVAKLAKPIKKTNDRDITFKIKLDL